MKCADCMLLNRVPSRYKREIFKNQVHGKAESPRVAFARAPQADRLLARSAEKYEQARGSIEDVAQRTDMTGSLVCGTQEKRFESRLMSMRRY